MKLKYHLIIFVIGIFTILLFQSCKKTPTDSSNELTNVILPLADGNYWTYIDSVWHFYTFDFRWEREIKVGITGTTKVNVDDNEYMGYYFNNYDLDLITPSENKSIYTNDELGLWSLGAESPSNIFLSRNLVIKYHVEVGDSWPYQIIGYDAEEKPFIKETVNVHCISKDELVSTVAGDYYCILYHYFENTYGDDVYLYYAPNIGLVAREVKKNGRLYIKWLLKFYSFGEF